MPGAVKPHDLGIVTVNMRAIAQRDVDDMTVRWTPLPEHAPYHATIEFPSFEAAPPVALPASTTP